MSFSSVAWLAVAGLSSCGGGPQSGHVIGSAGGEIVENGGKVKLRIPANAVDGDTEISLTPVALAGAIPGTAYELEPDGTVFKSRLTATIVYDPAELPPGTDESSLRIYSIGGSGVAVQVPEQTVDVAAHSVTAGIAHFSTTYVAPAPTPRIDVRLLSETQIEINALRGTKILRAHVGACPPNTTCSPHPFGCIDADFDPDPTRRPIQTDLRCVYNGIPAGECAGIPAPTIQDSVYAAGFYCYRIQDTDQMMEVYSFGAQVAPPNPPPNFQATANPANGSILLTWTAISPTAGDVTGYHITRNDGRPFRIDRPGISQHEDTNVTVGTRYTYTIYTVNDAGYSQSQAQASAVAPVKNDRLPGAPSSFVAFIPTGSSGTVGLNWGAIDRATSYVVARAFPPVTFPETASLSLMDSGLAPGQTYTYTLFGKNAEGNGPSRTVSITLSGSNSCQRGVQLSFSPPTVDLFPGTSADVAVMIRRLDAGQNITVTLSLDPASPLNGLLDFSVTGPNPTPANSTIHLTQSNVATAASGSVHVRATDGTTFGTCDIDYPVSLNP
jgi:hypothetical protein